MRWVFLNREQLVRIIYDTLRGEDATAQMRIGQVMDEKPLDGEDVLSDSSSPLHRERL
jgi:hypothetical protein